MNDNKNIVVVKRVPLEDLLNLLAEVYDTGVDYVDIIIEKGKHQDSFYIVNAEDNFKKNAENDSEPFSNFNKLI